MKKIKIGFELQLYSLQNKVLYLEEYDTSKAKKMFHAINKNILDLKELNSDSQVEEVPSMNKMSQGTVP